MVHRIPLHRSLLFLLGAGVMVMAPICWAWWQSRLIVSAVGYSDWELINFESRVSFGRVRTGQSGWHLPTGWPSIPVADASLRMRCPPPSLLQHEGGTYGSASDPARISGVNSGLPSVNIDEICLMRGRKGDWLCQMPHWLLLTGFALPWAGALLWWERKQRKTLLASPTVQARQEPSRSQGA